MFFKMKDIEKRFSTVVADYINKGYRIDTDAMRGIQGEIVKVAVTNGNVTHMIYLTRFSKCELGWADKQEGVKLVIETDSYKPNRGIFWLGAEDHTMTYSESWYQISYNRYDSNPTFIQDVEYLREALGKRSRRIISRYPKYEFRNVNYDPDLIIKIIKAKTGRKRVNSTNIQKVCRNTKANEWIIYTVFSGKPINIYIRERR